MAGEIALGLVYVIAAWLLMKQPRVFVVRADRGRFPVLLGMMLIGIGLNGPCDFHAMFWDVAHDHPIAESVRSIIEVNVRVLIIGMILICGFFWWIMTAWWGLRSWVRLGLGTAMVAEIGRAGLLVSGDAAGPALGLMVVELLGLWLAVCTGAMRHRRTAVPA